MRFLSIGILLFLLLHVFVIINGSNIIDYLNHRNQSILCFGDSLTHGMLVLSPTNWHQTHPYSIKLKELTKLNTIESGINGQTANVMQNRITHALMHAKSSGDDVGIVSILAGTNDLGHKENADKIISYVLNIHNKVFEDAALHNKKIFTIAITIPMISWGINDTARFDINKNLREFQMLHKDKIILVDLENEFDQKLDENKKYWSIDLAHFSELGYDTIASKIFNAMQTFEIVS